MITHLVYLTMTSFHVCMKLRQQKVVIINFPRPHPTIRLDQLILT